jgi:hypothetical protein
LEAIAYEDDPLHIMRVLEKEGWLKVLNPHWSVAKVDTQGLGQLQKTKQTMQELGYIVDAAPATMYFLTKRLPEKDVRDIQKAIPRKYFVESWKNLEEEAGKLAKKLSGKEAATPSRAWQVLSEAKPEALLFLELTARQQAVEQKIKNFFTKWRQLKQKLPLPEMAELRITPQLPEYPKIEQEAFMLLLDGKLRSRTEILKFLKPYSPPPPPPPPPPPAKRGRAAKADGAAAGAGAGKKKVKAAAAPPAQVVPPKTEEAPPQQPAARKGAKVEPAKESKPAAKHPAKKAEQHTPAKAKKQAAGKKKK